MLVAGITWLNGQGGSTLMDLGQFLIGLGIKLFLIGMIAISAMFLPGISGYTLLLIFGAYMPVISVVRGFLKLNFSYFPALVFFGCGVLVGAAMVVKGIRPCEINTAVQLLVTRNSLLSRGPFLLRRCSARQTSQIRHWLPRLGGAGG